MPDGIVLSVVEFTKETDCWLRQVSLKKLTLLRLR